MKKVGIVILVFALLQMLGLAYLIKNKEFIASILNLDNKSPLLAHLPLLGRAQKKSTAEKPQPPKILSVTYESARKDDLPIREVHLKKGTLTGISVRGEIWGFRDFIGATFLGYDEKRQQVRLRVQDYVSKQPLELYQFSYFDATTKKWDNICWTENQPKALAILIPGMWDTSGRYNKPKGVFSIACLNSPLGRCAELGYNPWKAFKKTPLAKYHQACVRMLRADYLGNGKSHTKNENDGIAFEDNLGYLKSKISPEMQFEAGWGASGAIQLARVRYKDLVPPGVSCPTRSFCFFTHRSLPHEQEVLIKNYSLPR